jgi:hypothetical protein
MVNPNFTPVHLESSAKTILAVKAKDPAADAKSLILEQVEVIKGEKNAGELKIDFTAALAEKDGQAAVDKFVNGLKGLSGEPALLAIGELDGKRAALLHANGFWARLSPGGNNDTWQFDRNDPALNSTFNGATDMLLETMRFIRKFPGTPIMPASNGVKWDTVEKIGHADGAVQALIPVAVDGGMQKLDCQKPRCRLVRFQRRWSSGLRHAGCQWRPEIVSSGRDGKVRRNGNQDNRKYLRGHYAACHRTEHRRPSRTCGGCRCNAGRIEEFRRRRAEVRSSDSACGRTKGRWSTGTLRCRRLHKQRKFRHPSDFPEGRRVVPLRSGRNIYRGCRLRCGDGPCDGAASGGSRLGW